MPDDRKSQFLMKLESYYKKGIKYGSRLVKTRDDLGIKI